MGDADGGVILLHVLPAGAASAKGIDADIFVRHFDFDIGLNVGPKLDLGE